MKKRILLVASFPPPVHGSAMVSKYILDSKLLNDEFEFDYVNLSTSRKMDEIGKNSPIKIIRFISSYLNLLFKLLIHRYALCYLAITVHGKGFLKDAPYVILCKLFRNRVLIHQHNKGMCMWVDKPLYKLLFQKCYKHTKVILLSWKLYPDISKIVMKKQVVICPNGIPSLNLNFERKFQKKEKVSLLFLSNLNLSKGVIELLDACMILKKKGINFECNFVGGVTSEINDEIFLSEAKKRGVEDIVKYLGKKYGVEKHEVFMKSDIFVQPTKDDCFPLTLLEACQYKLPIVCTDVGATSDIVVHNKNGLIVKLGDSLDLANAIESLIFDAKLREMYGLNGYDRFMKQFTIDIFEGNICNIFKSFCK